MGITNENNSAQTHNLVFEMMNDCFRKVIFIVKTDSSTFFRRPLSLRLKRLSF